MQQQKGRNFFDKVLAKHGSRKLLLVFILLLIALPLILFALRTIQEKIVKDKILNDRGSIDEVSKAFNDRNPTALCKAFGTNPQDNDCVETARKLLSRMKEGTYMKLLTVYPNGDSTSSHKKLTYEITLPDGRKHKLSFRQIEIENKGKKNDGLKTYIMMPAE